MNRLFLCVGVVALLFLICAPLAAKAEVFSASQLVEVFISLGIIAPEKAETARAAVANLDIQLATSSPAAFARALELGVQGEDVRLLQKILNRNALTQIAETGAGSPGNETDYFGPRTQSAVVRFQEMHAGDVLAPVGLAKGTGYVGTKTLAKLNSLVTEGAGNSSTTPSGLLTAPGLNGQVATTSASSTQAKQGPPSITPSGTSPATPEYLKRIAPRPRVLDVIKASVIDVWEKNSLSLRAEAERHAAALANLTENRARIRELLEDGTYSREDGKERLAEVQNQMIATKIALSEARIDQFDVEAAVTYATNFIADLGRQWFDLAPELRLRFQKLIFPEGVRYSRLTGFGTAKLGLIFKLCQENASKIPPLVDLRRVGWNQFHEELREWLALKRVSLAGRDAVDAGSGPCAAASRCQS